MTTSPISPDLIAQTHTLLKALRSTPYPLLESPDNVKRRASVALAIRIKPSYAHWPTNPTQKLPDLDAFFAQDWVRHGEPEVLFIKRASRKGDRWTSHVALPGGKRDPEDADDKAAAIRETWEEVGLDLNAYAIECGNLPQRLVTTHWGKKPLMVLCPYVFLVTTHQIPPLKLQPTEVASTHWIPLRSLQSPHQRTIAFEDVSSRLANQETGVKKWMLQLILGNMMFAAIALLPTESLHSTETPDPNTPSSIHNQNVQNPNLFSRLRTLTSDILNQYPSPHPSQPPLLLWGLTLGVVSDLLDLLPPHNALTLWTYPNFIPLDVRFFVWLLTYRFKERKRAELQSGTSLLHRPAFGAVSESLANSAVMVRREDGSEDMERSVLEQIGIPGSTAIQSGSDRPDETGLHGLGTGSAVGDVKNRKAAVATMLEGYYDIVRRAVRVALLGRAGFLIAVLWVVVRRLRRR